MTRAEIAALYRHDARGNITSPGKFEGEPLYAVAFYEIGLEGFADQDDGAAYAFEITQEDRATWPELPSDCKWVVIRESDNGFVHCEHWQENPELGQ
jgi:hypothetical protein